MTDYGIKQAPVSHDEQETLFPPMPQASGRSSLAALDELFTLTKQYRSKRSYHELLQFVARFRFYSPYNAMLVHVQRPGSTFVASPSRWLKAYHRTIRPGAQPLVILQPKGPVMFVFDVSDTEPEKNAPPLPMQVVNPFEVRRGTVGKELECVVENAKRDGIRITERNAGSQSAGQIGPSKSSVFLDFKVKVRPKPDYVKVQLRYELLLNDRHSREVRYATIAHELAHLYCGHLGSPNPDWWPDRSNYDKTAREMEAESVCYLVCQRIGIDNPSEQYLADYLDKDGNVPPISLEAVMKAAGLIEQMGRERMQPRKEKEAKKAKNSDLT